MEWMNGCMEFPVREKDFSKIEKKNNICINVYCYENKLTFPIYVSDQKFENSMNLLFVSYESLHYVPIYITYTSKILTDLQNKTKNKTKNKNKKYFCKSCSSVLVVKMC